MFIILQKLKASITPAIEDCKICEKTLCEHLEPCFATEAQPMMVREPDRINDGIVIQTSEVERKSPVASSDTSQNTVQQR